MGWIFNCDYKFTAGGEYRCKICGGTIVSDELNNRCCQYTSGYRDCGYYSMWKKNGGEESSGEISKPLRTGMDRLR